MFFTLDLAFLMLGIGYLQNGSGAPQAGCIKAGGVFGILAAFFAWYNALAGIADNSNRLVTPLPLYSIIFGLLTLMIHSFFVIPVAHFPWSEKGRERRAKVNNDAARAEQAV